ncbi:MAG: FHA domain-containing protein [Solirubrobacterales bacterium]
MSVSHRLTPEQLKRRLELERAGDPFLECPGTGGEALHELPESGRVTIGRHEDANLTIEGDEKVSRFHAQLDRVGDGWVVADDGLSTNGTWLKGARIAGRRRLHDGDAIGIGRSVIVYRHPAEQDDRTATASDATAAPVTEAQRRVLVALCRPFRDGSEFGVPATNKEIASEVFLSTEAVKAHLRALFERFGVTDLPQTQKRLKLAENALRSGAVSPTELRDYPDR